MSARLCVVAMRITIMQSNSTGNIVTKNKGHFAYFGLDGSVIAISIYS
jgi:hypothetical protein